MPTMISISANQYSAQLPAHRFRQGNREVFYFTLDLPTLDGLLPQRIDDTVVREANRRLTPSHARRIQQYLEGRDDWLLGALLLGIAPDATEFEPYQDAEGNEINPNFGELRIRTNRANTMRIFDGQHRRRAIQDTLDFLDNEEHQRDKLIELRESSVPVVLYVEDDVKALRQMFSDASKTKRIEANVVTRFDKRDPFNLAAMHLAEKSKLFHGRVEMDRTTVSRGSHSLISINQLAQTLRAVSVGYSKRVSRNRSSLFMEDIEGLYTRCLDWSDSFMPRARWEYEELMSGAIKNHEIPTWRAESSAYSTTFIRILAGCFHTWLEDEPNWKGLANFIRGATLDVGSGYGSLLVDAGATLPGATSLSGRRQEVDGAIRYIVEMAQKNAR